MFSPRRIAVLSYLLLVVAAGPGVSRVHFETDATASFVPRSGREAEIYVRYLERFPPDFGTIVIATGDLWNEDRWSAFVQLAEDLTYLESVDRVIGLPTTEYVVGTDEIVEVEDFVDLEVDSTEELGEIAGAYPPYQRRLLTEDGQAIALYVACKREVDAVTFDAEVSPVVAEYRTVFEEGGGDLFQSGDQYVSAEIARQTQASTLVLAFSMIIMLVVAWLTTRSFGAGVLCVGTGVFGMYFTFALMGYAGITVNSVSSLTVNMILPLGTAFTIHAVEYVRRDQRFLFRLVPVTAIGPFLFATGSTMIGFGTTSISQVENIVQFGLLGVFGIAMCLVTTVLVTFPLLSRLSRTRPVSESTVAPPILLAPLRMRTPTLVALTLALLVVSFIGERILQVNYEAIDYLLPSNEARINADRGTELFSRHNMPLVFPGSEPNSALDVERWRKIDAFATELVADYPDVKTAWIYDQIEQLSLAFTADDKHPTRMPDSSALLEQYLLLFDERDIEPYIDADRQDLVLLLQIPFRNSIEYRAFKADLSQRLGMHGLEGNLTGRQKLFFEVGDRIALDNRQSLSIGLAILFVVFSIMLRSARTGLIAIFINALPVLGCLGFMGYFGFDLDLGNSIVAAVALGIVVDDTGHMIVRYNAHRRAGKGADDAVRLMLAEMWRPVTVTTVVIVIGFSVLNLAPLVPFHTFSRTLSATMVFALICDLVLLPALLVKFDRREVVPAQ